MEQRVAIVTGGNRGIGRAVADGLAGAGLHVILTARSAEQAAAAAADLADPDRRLTGLPLDVTDAHSTRRFLKRVADDFGRADVLVNNAGIFVDRDVRPLEMDEALLRQTLETNLYGPLRLIRALVPLMERHDYGRIVNVSSRMGSLSQMGGAGNALAYRTSKAALNALTRVVAGDVGDRIKINAASPGWVRTDMGGAGAARSPAEGADTIIWLALLPDDGPSGGFFHDRAPLDW